MFRLRAAALFIAAASCLSLSAQMSDTAVMKGTVTDSTRAALAGVHILVKNELTGLERQTVSDGNGHFTLAGLPVAGAYDVVATKDQFVEAHLSHVGLRMTDSVVGRGAHVFRDFSLPRALRVLPSSPTATRRRRWTPPICGPEP